MRKSEALRPSVAVKIGSEKFIAQMGAEKFLARRRRKRYRGASKSVVLQRCVGKAAALTSAAVKIGSEKVLSQTQKERSYRGASKSAVLQSCGPDRVSS